MKIAEDFPQSTVVSIDICQEFIDRCQKEAMQRNIHNVQFKLQDATFLPPDWSERFDYIIANNTIHDIPLASQALLEINRSLKPRGLFSMVEVNISSDIRKMISSPAGKAMGRFAFPLSLYHCLPASMSSEDSLALGAYVGAERLQQIAESNGFVVKDVDRTRPGFMHLLCMKKKNRHD